MAKFILSCPNCGETKCLSQFGFNFHCIACDTEHEFNEMDFEVEEEN